MRFAIQALLRGPNTEESRKGYLSSFSAASASIPFRVARLPNGLAVVDFDRSILNLTAPRQDPTQNARRLFVATMDAHQIVATLGQFSGVRRVAILIGGQPLCRAKGEC
jgi:spore germination protein GerM